MTDMPRDDLLKHLHEVLEAVKDPVKLDELQQKQYTSAYAEALEAICMTLFWKSREVHKLVVELLTKAASDIGTRMSLIEKLLMTKTLKQGEIAVWDVKPGDITFGVTARKSETVGCKDTKFSPPEFILDAKPFIEQRFANNARVFEEFIEEVIEGVAVNAERILMHTLRSQTATYKAGETLNAIKATIERLALPEGNIVVDSRAWLDLIGDTEFQQDFEPVTKHELLLRGQLGVYKEKYPVYTDAYRHPTHRLLEQGEILVLPVRTELGGFTSRGWEGECLTGATEKMPGRGGWIYDCVSLMVTSTRFATLKQEQ